MRHASALLVLLLLSLAISGRVGATAGAGSDTMLSANPRLVNRELTLTASKIRSCKGSLTQIEGKAWTCSMAWSLPELYVGRHIPIRVFTPTGESCRVVMKVAPYFDDVSIGAQSLKHWTYNPTDFGLMSGAKSAVIEVRALNWSWLAPSVADEISEASAKRCLDAVKDDSMEIVGFLPG